MHDRTKATPVHSVMHDGKLYTHLQTACPLRNDEIAALKDSGLIMIGGGIGQPYEYVFMKVGALKVEDADS